ncbi:virulence-associated E family protein [Antribacter sp. KLBMP9083]|uniref:Virulence-associated E family protein n=1 Tax=Antribacter soli TaxID=2910976 RepID=A0AA41QGF0_9MICO|nr:virulence-associated E family protein [Antribacter soli]MCF4122181.1 virulence-associated E family protein [Antribacter soli]
MSAPRKDEKVTDQAPAEGTAPAETAAGEASAERKSAAAILVDLALERYDLGCTPDGEPYAVPRTGGNVVRMLRGKGSLRAELAKAYRQHTGAIAGGQALADALLVLEGTAAECEPEAVHVRVAEHDGATWIDLGDTTERVVRVDARGWEVVAECPVLFRRSVLTAALPTPEPGGSLDELWELLNVTPSDRPLVLGWLVAALGWARIPHPMLALLGEQGTGKSSATRNLVQLVDPSPVSVRKPPKDVEAWVTAAQGSWVVGLDNMSTIPAWLSDSLCRAVTGDGDVRRQLYSDDGLAVFSFRRVLVMNGIDVGAMAPDLADRSIVVNLDRITEDRRRPESQLMTAWEAAWPRVFGALLSQVAVGKARIRSVRLDAMPRMADFAMVLAALDQVHGTNSLAAYQDQANSMAADAVTSDPFLAAITEHVTTHWQGTAAELLGIVQPDGALPRTWPRNSRAAAGVLKRNAPALRSAGWVVDDLPGRTRQKVAVWRLVPPEMTGEEHPQHPHTRNHAADQGEFSGNGAGVPAGVARGAGVKHPHTREHPHRHPQAFPQVRPHVAGVAGVAGVASPSSQDAPCPDCGEPLTGPGYTARCRPNHTLTTLEVAHHVA